MGNKSLSFGSKPAAQQHASENTPPVGKQWTVVVATPGNGKPQSISLMPSTPSQGTYRNRDLDF